MNEKKTPRIRFKGFTNDWEQRKLGEFFKKYQNTVYLQDEEEYRQISIRNTGVVEYRCTNKGKNIGRKRQYLIDTDTHPVTLTFTRQTVYEGGIGFVPKELNGAIVTENMPLLEMTNACQDFMKALFNTSGYYKSVINDDTLIGSAQKALHEKQWLDSYVCVPILDEQKQIGSFFQQLDNLITLHQRKYEKLQIIKKSMLENCFPKNGEKVPRIRFAGFTGDWEQRKFSEIAQRESTAKKSSTDFPSVEYEDVVSEVGILNKDVRLKETQKTGIGFDGSQVLYGKLRPYLHNWLSPDFSGVAVGDWWVLKPVNVDKSFLFRLIQTEKFDDIANQSSGSKMPRADWNLLSNTEFMVPAEIEEERKIGQYFSELDHLITLHQSKAEKLQKIKKSLLERMFA
ncbi:MAG: restriction endonuclease subunit S [Erysipelotrichaceae bacterium]|jgi:type I restriction enzyme S subunit|nr:restriction endonuclease subunit S [Erysipelotrichaceae bacterium]MCI1326346.1 restriction endonuclease subunit S [Solobacterium sp.]MCH4044464.1 restriction endonuclease subunit S [Erysipelotrichaceae bacterium]MCH4121676.1 restriction endonuclease subunit S [Erysipelotrichaceae bacterium]MCI1362947.1 restriction endonuclease subunit S [Solobacterium sp.]